MRRPKHRVTYRRPALSQHFLRRNAARALVRRAALPPDSLIVEPGAGEGAITVALAERGHRVIAVEVDALLFAALRKRFDGHPHVEVYHADFLTFALPTVPYHVVSNLPYASTAAFVRRLLHAARPPKTAALVMQREGAEKFAGVPRETAFSLLNKPRFEITIAGTVHQSDFMPPPRVRSAILTVRRRDEALMRSPQMRRYRAFIEAAFAHGAPQIAPGLRRFLTNRQIDRLGHNVGFTRETRTSQLGFDQWLAIFRFVEHECLGHDPTRRVFTVTRGLSLARRSDRGARLLNRGSGLQLLVGIRN